MKLNSEISKRKMDLAALARANSRNGFVTQYLQLQRFQK